jgi:hypothetical protein
MAAIASMITVGIKMIFQGLIQPPWNSRVS